MHIIVRLLATTTVALLAATIGAPVTTQAADAQFVGPRNTIPRPLVVEHPSKSKSMARLRAARNEMAECTTLRATHRGHPGKGIQRVTRVSVECSRARMSRVE